MISRDEVRELKDIDVGDYFFPVVLSQKVFRKIIPGVNPDRFLKFIKTGETNKNDITPVRALGYKKIIYFQNYFVALLPKPR